MSGPMTEARAYVAESEPVMAGRIFRLEENAIIMKHPENKPAQPTPVIARPAMKAWLLGASAVKRIY